MLVCPIRGNVGDWSEVLVERKEWSLWGISMHLQDAAVNCKSIQIAGFFLQVTHVTYHLRSYYYSGITD